MASGSSRSTARHGQRGATVRSPTSSTPCAPPARRCPATTWPHPEPAAIGKPCGCCSTARQTAITGRTKAIGQLKALIVGAPEALRDQLRRGTTDTQLDRCARLRTLPGHSVEHRATVRAIRAVARRALFLEAEAAEHETDIEALVVQACPALLDRPGIGALTAAQLLISWSHPGRIRNEAAFAALAGVSPIPASSGQTQRHRLNRSGDRQLNRALHTVTISRLQHHDPTKAYAQKRTAEGKTPREIKRCLKRAIARETYRLMEKHAKTLKDINKVA